MNHTKRFVIETASTKPCDATLVYYGVLAKGSPPASVSTSVNGKDVSLVEFCKERIIVATEIPIKVCAGRNIHVAITVLKGSFKLLRAELQCP